MKHLLFVIFSAFTVVSSLACVHPPREYPGKFGSKVQEYLFYQTGDTVHMIVNQRIQSSTNLPPEMAWVIPTPSLPISYSEESDSVFRKLFQGTGIGMRGNSPQKKVKVHDKVYTGSYEITPLEVLDKTAGSEINNWLYANGYDKIPSEGLKYYLKPNACFLAIRVRGLKGREKTLKPIHIVYKSTEFRPPLKFFAKAGIFDAYVYTVSEELDVESQNKLEAFGFIRNGINSADLMNRIGLKRKPIFNTEANVNRYLGSQLNSEKNPISKWSEDPVF